MNDDIHKNPVNKILNAKGGIAGNKKIRNGAHACNVSANVKSDCRET